MDAAAHIPRDSARRPDPAADRAGLTPEAVRRPALDRLEDAVGPELARRLVSALATRLR